jgi:hypothetical protein
MDIIQSGRQGINEVPSHCHEFSVAAVHRISRERRLVAQILHFVTTEPAIAVDAAHPGNADARSDRQVRGRALDDFSDDLMTRGKPRPQRRQIPFDDMQVGATNSASQHSQQHMPGFDFRTRDIFEV